MANGAPVEIQIPDFDLIVAQVANEVRLRVARRTPRSALGKKHLQDAWVLEKSAPMHYRVVNNFPYANFVENGTSKMAPRYMVRKTLAEVPQILAEIMARQQMKSKT